MIEQIQQFIKDPAKLTRLTVIGFFVAVLLTTYFLFTLPGDLVYQGGMIDSGRATGVFAKLFIMTGLAFAFCYGAIHYLQISKRETIVYLDKKIDESTSQGSKSASGHGHSSFNLNSLREAISKEKTREEKLQQGLNQLCHQMNAGQGAVYSIDSEGDEKKLNLKSGFALVLAEGEQSPSFEIGEGLIGQVAASGKSLYLDELPEGYAARIESGLGASLPKFLFILPLKKEDEIKGVVEVALFTALSEGERKQAIEAGSILAEIS
jgi:methyl-accepting chemotaxis protein